MEHSLDTLKEMTAHGEAHLSLLAEKFNGNPILIMSTLAFIYAKAIVSIENDDNGEGLDDEAFERLLSTFVKDVRSKVKVLQGAKHTLRKMNEFRH